MYEEIKEQWVGALRSGRFIQGKAHLCTKNGEFHCCLGVLGSLLGFTNEELHEKAPYEQIIVKAGLTRDIQWDLIHRNDGMSPEGPSDTFSEIASYIETEL